jgi:peptide/nickel transport system permease protein
MSDLTTSVEIKSLKKFIPELNRRQKTLIITAVSILLLLGIVIASIVLGDEKIATHLNSKNLSPSWEHPFGTDWLGRDMFIRTIKGLSLSIGVGMVAAASSVIIALILGMAAATMGKVVDSIITWLVDLFLGMPHLVALILIAFTLGGGAKGVIVGVACTHWTSLTRVIRAEYSNCEQQILSVFQKT